MKVYDSAATIWKQEYCLHLDCTRGFHAARMVRPSAPVWDLCFRNSVVAAGLTFIRTKTNLTYGSRLTCWLAWAKCLPTFFVTPCGGRSEQLWTGWLPLISLAADGDTTPAQKPMLR